MSDDTRSPITEEMLVQFLIDHNIRSAEEFKEFSLMITLMEAEPDRICGHAWSEDVTVH